MPAAGDSGAPFYVNFGHGSRAQQGTGSHTHPTARTSRGTCISICVSLLRRYGAATHPHLRAPALWQMPLGEA